MSDDNQDLENLGWNALISFGQSLVSTGNALANGTLVGQTADQVQVVNSGQTYAASATVGVSGAATNSTKRLFYWIVGIALAVYLFRKPLQKQLA